MSFFFFIDTATTEIFTYLHTLSLHDALPIYLVGQIFTQTVGQGGFFRHARERFRRCNSDSTIAETRPAYRIFSVSVQSPQVGPLRNGQPPCFSGAQPLAARLRLPASTPMSSSVVAIESFPRLRKPNSA